MKMFTLSFAAAGFAALVCDTTAAAPPAYCALYAREFANHVFQQETVDGTTVRIQDRAYYHCLNQDEVPELPIRSAYFDDGTMSEATARSIWQFMRASNLTAMSYDEYLATLDIDLRGPQADVHQHDDISAGGPITASATATPPETRIGRSRRTPWTTEWVAWCSSHYPNSFDPETGLIVPLDTLEPELC